MREEIRRDLAAGGWHRSGVKGCARTSCSLPPNKHHHRGEGRGKTDHFDRMHMLFLEERLLLMLLLLEGHSLLIRLFHCHLLLLHERLVLLLLPALLLLEGHSLLIRLFHHHPLLLDERLVLLEEGSLLPTLFLRHWHMHLHSRHHRRYSARLLDLFQPTVRLDGLVALFLHIRSLRRALRLALFALPN